MNNITFVVFTYNEEKRIWYVIRNLIKYWKVLIIDNFSTDNTKNISEEMWAKVEQFQNQWYVETKEELEFVKSKINTDYMTWWFADWIYPKDLLEKITEITNEWEYDWINIIQKNYHYWVEKLNFMTHWLLWKRFNKWWCKVLKKNMLYIEWVIHSALRNNCKKVYDVPKEDNYMVHHLSTYNVKKFELAHSRYSDIEAKMLYESWTKSSIIKMILKVNILFFKSYIIDLWFLSGKKWFIMAMEYSFFYFNAWAKHYELENNVTIESIEDNYNKIREKFLKDI